jgi:predicted type IV restriction endonuclease
MLLEDHIAEIRSKLIAGAFPNEASVSGGVVVRLLQSLEWPVFDPQVVYPEFSVNGGRVDYALCHPAKKPLVFVEFKPVGGSGGAERQLFEYAFHLAAIIHDGYRV